MARCPFCDIPTDKFICSNDHAYAIRDTTPVTPLHTLVLPRRHGASFFELSASELQSVAELVGLCRDEIRRADPSVEGFNFGINDGDVAGQTIFHCHVHVIPRRRGDVANPRGGVRAVIPGKAVY